VLDGVNLDSLLDATMSRAGLDDRAEAALALEATVEVLGECVPAHDADDLASALPPALGRAAHRPRRHRLVDVDELFERIREKEEVRLGLAVELAKAACEVLAEQLDPELRARLQLHLPAGLARLLVPRRFQAPDRRPQTKTGQGHTLASGRPGSTHPVSEAAAPGAQTDSVVVAGNPHGDRKLSSGGAEGPGQTLATGRPGSVETLADARDERKDR
jgi:uncharacterized protein (DUF2267 family)